MESEIEKRGKNIVYRLSPRALFYSDDRCGKKRTEVCGTILPECTPQLQEIYHQTKEGNGQRWLMIDLEDRDDLYEDILRLIEIRRNV